MKRLLPFFGFITLSLVLLGCQQIQVKSQQPTASSTPQSIIQQPAKFGFIDRTGKMVIAPQFESTDRFSEGLAFVKKNKQVGYIDRQGKFALRSRFDPTQPFSDGLTPISISWLKGRQGFIDKTGVVVLRLPAEVYAGPFWKGLAIARDNHYHFGVIDKTGKFIVHPQFVSPKGDMDIYSKPLFTDGLELMSLNGTLADKMTNWAGSITDGTWVYINKRGQFAIQTQALFARQFSEGLAAINKGKWKPEKRHSIDRWGFIDRTGQFVIAPQFDDVGSFSEGLAMARLPSPDGLSHINYGYINRKGEFAIPPQFEDATTFSEGLAAVDIDGKYGYIDKSGKIIIPPQFRDAYAFSEGIAKVSAADGVGYINKQGQYIAKPQFGNGSQDFSEGLAVVQVP
jgi:WG containing repeat